MTNEALTTRPQVFTEYLSRLEASDEPPEDEHVSALLEALRETLRGEIEKRGLWDTPPSYLGVYGLGSWQSADWQAPFLSEQGLANQETAEWDLVIDCFKYIFIDRYPYLVRHLAKRPNIEGMIRRNVRNFLHDTQKKHDPLGFRIFTIVRAAVLRAVDEGELFVLRGDPRIRNHTVLGHDESDPAAEERSPDLAEISRSWNDVLLPDLITARGRHQETVVAMLRNLLAKLPAQGIETFRFGDLIQPLKHDVAAAGRCFSRIPKGRGLEKARTRASCKSPGGSARTPASSKESLLPGSSIACPGASRACRRRRRPGAISPGCGAS